ncbi:hypothetical protein cyc_00868 [Cyclospora cayetanensis]|uniref:Uncharacterized protein n=1 Tax=Cyclospora cayetanensis TaxID=88456 RepID=A0A1D3D868_9EIME|nr:hypothetical protein cyc_00868 [Cyclospora cayetanensis]
MHCRRVWLVCSACPTALKVIRTRFIITKGRLVVKAHQNALTNFGFPIRDDAGDESVEPSCMRSVKEAASKETNFESLTRMCPETAEMQTMRAQCFFNALTEYYDGVHTDCPGKMSHNPPMRDVDNFCFTLSVSQGLKLANMRHFLPAPFMVGMKASRVDTKSASSHINGQESIGNVYSYRTGRGHTYETLPHRQVNNVEAEDSEGAVEGIDFRAIERRGDAVQIL